MSLYGSQKGLNMTGRRAGSKGDLTGGMTQHYARSEVVHGGGNGYDPYVDGYNTYTFSKSSMGGMAGGMMGGMAGGGMGSLKMSGMGGGMVSGMSSGMGGGMSGSGAIHQRAVILQGQCQEYLKKAEYALQTGSSGDAERFMSMAKETIEQLKGCAVDLRQMGQPNDNVVRTLEMCKDQLKGVHMAISGTMTRRRSTRGSSGGGWEEPGRSFQDAMGWIAQHKRLIETAPWGDDPAAIEQQLISHQKFHGSIQRCPEMDRARDDLIKKGDKGNLHALDQEWDSLQQMSFGRTQQLQELQQIIQEMSKEIMWVNSREEEELMFDWGDKNIDQYIPRKQESYSKLMSALEDKEKDLNKLKAKVDNLLKNNHPATDKIEAYKDTLQTQWSWLLQITKCIDVHLKENAAYNQFFKEANETYSNLQKEHEMVRKKFTCDKNTSLEDLVELLRGLEKEKERIMENKRQVQHLVNSSKNIVRLKPRNPEEKSSSGVIVKALCDFKQDQKVICKGNEAILKDNSQRSKWEVTGPGGLDMTVPSVCLIIPPPNPLSISLASKNEQYYDAILSIWNQLYINVKSLITWQYCLQDIRHINSLTISMLAKMRPEEYRQLIKSLETHFEEFKVSCQGSQMFADEDKRTIENQFTGAQAHYDQLVVQLPTYIAQVEAQQVSEQQQQQEFIIIQQAAEQQHQQELIIIQQQQAAEQQRQQELLLIQQQQQAAAAAAAEAEARRLEEERRKAELKKLAAKKEVVKKEVVKVTKTEPVRRKVVVSNSSAASAAVSTSHSLSELHALRLRLEAAEGTLSQHVHICLGDDGMQNCGLKIIELEAMQRDVDTMRTEYLRLREIILKELEGMNDSDKAQFLRSEIGIINQRLDSLESSSSAYLHRLRALRDMLESVARAEDIVKVHEARLTEKETTSLMPSEVEDYILTLTTIKAELDQKKSVLASMESELAKASHWNSQVGGPFHRCDMMLSKYTEEVGLLSDRWRRITGQIDTRLQDLHVYQPQLQRYKETSSSLIGWIDATRKKQDALQATKIESIQALKEHIDNQKALNTEIKSKREQVESVLKDNEACVNSIKDYETDLACYTSGLETLLNIPIKRTMLKSPSMDLNLEATQIQTRYMELLTLSGDYYKFLGQLYKNMEELKMSNTRIDLLEEELRLLREGIQDRDSKNKSLEDAVARYQLELSQSQNQLLSMEEVKQSAALQCSATKDSLDSTQSQLAELNDEVTRLKYLLEEEKRKRRLAEERYTQQQEEYDLVLRKRQKELETVSWSKVDVEKSVASKDHEIEQLRRQLAEESARIKELQKEMSKVRSQCSTEINKIKLSYESQIHASRSDIQRLAAQREDDTAELQLQYDRMMAERRNLEDELRRLRMSISEVEEQRQRAEEEAHSQRAVITEEGRRRRELESQVEVLTRQRDEKSKQYSEELAEVMKSLDEKREELAYITHSLEEETRRRRTIEEGQGVLEQTLAQMQVKLTNSSITANQLGECKEELQKTCLELERESRERSRVEQNMSRLQGRMKDLQAVRDGLESQVENLRKANQEEVARRRQAETELEKTTIAMTDYSSTITSLRQSQDQASMLEKRGEEERFRLQEGLERSLRQNKSSAERMTQLSSELKAVQQQLLQEQARVKEANLRNESLCRTTEERSKALNENTVELKRLREMTETQAQERLRLEEKLRAAQRVEEEHLRLQEDLERSLRQNKSSAESMTQLSAELKAVQQQLLQEQARVKEANLRNESLCRTTEERSKALNENTVELKRLREMTETQTKERLRLEEELQAAQRSEEERLRLQEELERSLRQNKSSAESMTQLSAELKAVQQQLLQEQARVKEANLRNESLCRTTEERSKALNENTAELKRLKEMTETQTKERLRLEEELQAAQRSKEEHLRLQEELERSLRQNKSSAESMTQLSAELKAMQQQLLQEQARVKEANLRNESLYKTIEERSKALNENTAELQRLKEMTETLTKERLRLEEELRAARHDKEELLRSKQGRDDELSSQISALELQLKASERSIIDYRNLVSELSSEREKLKLETEKIQNQATETAAMMQSIQSQYNEIVSERDALLLKLQLSEKDKDRLQRLEEELSNIKLSLESELRNKQRIQDENERMKRDLSYWKDQYDSKQGLIRQYDTDKERLEREKNSLKSEIERLMRELRELEETYKNKLAALQKELREMTMVRQNMETELKKAREPPTLDGSTVVFDGVRKSVTADQLLDCGVLDKPTFSQLVKGHKTVPEVSVDKKINLKGTGPIAGVIIESSKRPGSITGPICKMTFAEAKRENLLPSDSVDLLLDAQAATGHIIDPRTNQKLTVEEACNQGVVDEEDKERLLAAEAAAVGYSGPGTSQPLSVFQAMKKGLTDRNTTLRLLQAQESVGGVLDPKLSVFLPKNTAMERKLIDDDISRALSQRPELYLDPESEEGVTYMSMKRRCKVEPHTGLLLLPVPEKVDPSKLVFDGVRKPVTAKQLVDCGVLDKPTFKDLEKGKKTVPEVSVDKNVNLKGTGPIAGVIAGSQGKMSLSEAKKKMLLPEEAADLLLEAQAATGHIIDPRTNQKLTVEEACARGVVEISDRDKLLAAEAAAVGYKDPSAAKPLSVFEAVKKGLIDRDTGLCLLQAQESVGGILDPNLSVFLPKDTAIKRNILDENLRKALNQSPECYLDPETENDVTYGALKKRCKTEPHTGLLLLPITERKDPSKLVFDGVRKPVTAQQLLDCGVLDKPTFNQLMKGEKTVPEVAVDKKVPLKGTGSIAGVVAGPSGKMSLSEAKKQMVMPADSADLLLDAQAATGHIIDPTNNQKLTVEEACARGVVDTRDRDRLLTAEGAAVGYRDPSTGKPLSVFEAMKKGIIDRKSGLRLLQAQESAGGILDPNLSVFLPKETAIKRNLLDEELSRALNSRPECYLDPDTERDTSYGALKKRCKTESHTGLVLLPVTERKDPSKLIFDGVRKPVTAQQLLDCGVLDKPTFNQLVKGEKTVPEVSVDKKVFLKGTGSISGVAAGPLGKMSLSEAKKQMVMPPDTADLLLEAQAATGHIIDPTNNQKLTVEEACTRGVVDTRDRDRLLTAEGAAVGYRDPSTGKPLSVFEAMKKGIIDRKTGLRLLQAQESAGGILDPNLSVFLPKETAIKRNLLDEELSRALNSRPECYLDPDIERDTSYGALKKRCKTESQTGLILLPVTERKDPSKLIFDGVRKPVTAQQLLDCGVLDKATFNQLVKGEKTVPEVSVDKKVFLKGTGSIAGVAAGPLGKMSLSEAKKQMVMPPDSADLLLEAQAATGHIADLTKNQKLTVEEACARGVVNNSDRDRLLTAEGAGVGYRDPSTGKLLSVFEAMKKGIIDRKTGLRLLQAQESAGGILDPNLSVFLPKETAIKRNLLDEELSHALNSRPDCYIDPDTERDTSYGALKRRCKTESHTGLILLPITERKDPSKLIFDGVRKPVSAQQLLECEVLDKPTFDQLVKGQRTVSEVSVDKKVFLKGTGSIAGVAAGPLGKMSFTEAKKQKIMSSDSADMLLAAQAATGYIVDPRTNQKLNVKEACARGVVDKEDESKLFAAEAAVIGYRDPNTTKLLSAGQAMKRGLIDKDTALRILQAQQSVGGIFDPNLSVFLPKNIAMDRNLIDEELCQALNQYPECYLDPDTQQATTYLSLQKKCKADRSTGLLLLPEPEKPPTVQGLRGQVSVIDLVDANLLERSDMDRLREGRLTSQDIEDRLRPYLRGSTCIAGVYDEAGEKVMPIYQAMKEGLLRPGTTLELLEAQAASGFIVDPVNNVYLSVSDAYNKRLFGPEFKDKLLSAEKAVTGYKVPGTDKVISLFQAIERGLIERGHGIRLLEAQIASGGIIDPEHGHRIDLNVAYKRGYFDEKMNKILTDQGADSKGFFDPNTEENLTYLELKKSCITDKKTGLILLPIMDKKKKEATLKNTLRKRRVVIVDPETNREMTVRQAYDRGLIDYDTYVELSEQECEWEEITITDPDGSTRFLIIDKKTGRQYDITELLENKVIDQSDLDKYRSRAITLTQFADIIANKTKYGSSYSVTSSTMSKTSAAPGTSSTLTSRTPAASGTSSMTSSMTSSSSSAASATTTLRPSSASGTSSMTSSSSTSRTSGSLGASSSSSSSSVLSRPLSPTLAKTTTTRTTTITERSGTMSSVSRDSPDSLRNISSVSITLASPVETMGEQEPVGAIFDTETLEKISITEALNRGLVDSITAQRLLEAQACTGGIVNPTTGQRVGIQEACRLGIIDDDMAPRLKPAQKAYIGFEDVKTRRKISVAEAVKEMWLPYEAGQRFMEFQYVTGGLYDPEMGCRRTIQDALKMGWIDERTAQKLQDLNHHTKNLTCPKSKLKISYKEALDNCLAEERTGVKMLQASSVSSRGISSPYNVSSAPGSATGSRSGSRRSSRRSSVDLGSPSASSASRYSHSFFSFSSTSAT